MSDHPAQHLPLIAYLAIAGFLEFIIGILNPDPCNYDGHLTARILLIVLGVSDLAAFLMNLNITEPVARAINTVILLFKFTWIIIGAIVLLAKNTSCITQHSTTTIIALVMWILSIFVLIAQITIHTLLANPSPPPTPTNIETPYNLLPDENSAL